MQFRRTDAATAREVSKGPAGEAGNTNLRHALDSGAQDKRIELLLSGPQRMLNNPDCNPGYYNNEGQPNDQARYFISYPMGALTSFRYLEGWLASGTFEGLEFA